MAEKKRAGVSGRQQAMLGRTEQRPYWVLNLSVVIRAAHQVGAAVFLAAYLLDQVGELPRGYTSLAVISGAALVMTEWLRHRQLYREFSGIVTLGKCILLGAAMHGLLPAMPTVLIAFLAASLGAHMPKNVRHRLLV